MSRYVDIKQLVSATYYDEEHEEWSQKIVSIEDLLCSACDDFVEATNVQPVAMGKWKILDKHTAQCSVCNNTLDLRGVNAGRGDANYCPNCGADMRGEV